MSIQLTTAEQLARCRADFRMGVGVVLCDGASQWIVASAETLSAPRFDGLRALGDLEIAITNWRAVTLSTWANDGDIARIFVPNDQGLDWVRSMADPSDDLRRPMLGPFQHVYDGDAQAHRLALSICKSAHLLPAAVVVRVTGQEACGLHSVDLQTIKEADAVLGAQLAHISTARVPLKYSKDARVHVFRPQDGGEEHYAIEIGNPSRAEPVLSRLHSACFTGDLIGSLKCDCGPQLDAALKNIAEDGAGVLLYMNQEGRGIGLANKMRAYALQDQGFDTVEANHRLGFEDDERNFLLGAEILRLMGFDAVRLMTNNPAKVDSMNTAGIAVSERVPLKAGHNHLNADYLATKAAKSGHLL
ncbi:GTP cyclohydrolase-2 [Amylibacter marinus]|uniref:GTP cyclohydrolase-2 n=1 Tax=Amylibacter marinus TaxID=1475483 RepID=A0ABQ5VVT4_9RHOB|nr:GTP cyclohydrolase II [Amylibacter marinus]GLQ35409.1 GTP cyclohydrolase-2 [Amylibacter marinus]